MDDKNSKNEDIGNREISDAVSSIFSAIKSKENNALEISLINLVKICRQEGLEAKDTLDILKSQGFKSEKTLEEFVRKAHEIARQKEQ